MTTLSPGRIWAGLPFVARLLVATTLALIIAGGAMLFVSAKQEANDIRQELGNLLAQELESLPGSIAETVLVGDYSTLQQTLDHYVKRPRVHDATFVDTAGFSVGSHKGPTPSTAPRWFTDWLGFDVLSGTAPVSIGGREYGDLTLTLTAAPLAARAWLRLVDHLSILTLAVLLDFLCILWILRTGLLPLKHLERGARDLAAGNLEARIKEEGSPELRHLIAAFNHMAEANHVAHRQLNEALTLQLAILNHAAYSIIATTPEGLITHFNPAAERMLGYQAEEVIGKATPAIIHDWDEVIERTAWVSAQLGEHIEPGFETFVALSRRQLPNEQEWTYLTRDGHRIPVQLAVTALREESGEITGFLGIASDITERKSTETALRQAKEYAESASRAKSTFLATMSHELRTPLNGVMGMAQLLMDTHVSDEERLDWSKTIFNSGQTLLTLLNDVLDLSKIEAGKIELEHAAYHPDELLHEIQLLFTEAAHLKGLEFHVEVGLAPDQACWGDAFRLRQVLSNLVTNALKFTHSGSVTLRCELLAAARTGEPEQLRYTVIDTGIGIQEDRREALFQAFSQVDNSITRRYGGTGLGLCISRSLIELMRGSVGVESQIGVGSSFWITLPFDPVEGTGDQQHADCIDPSPLAGQVDSTAQAKRILVAEDITTNQQVIRIMLRRLGYEPVIVANGKEACELIEHKGHGFYAILMDCQMPVMDGFTAVQHIRAWEQESGEKRVPILALTAGAFADDRTRCLASGMDDFLTKPIHRDALSEALAAHEKSAYAGSETPAIV